MIFLPVAVGCGGNQRWVQKAELSIPSENYETCIRNAVSTVPGASIGGLEYGRLELHIKFQRPLKGVRVYIQTKDNGKADLMFIGDDWSEPKVAKDEFTSFFEIMSDAVLRQCYKN
jgi:hypothetical protein